MLRTLSDTVYRDLLASFPENQHYHAEDFSKAPMPVGFSHFLQKTLTRRLEIEFQRYYSDWFDFQDETVQEDLAKLRHTLSQKARIPKSEWAQILQNTTRLIVSYLIRPTHTLTGFVYGNDTELSQEIIVRRIAYFHYYAYFQNIVTAHLSRKGLKTLNKEKFLDLLTQIDRRMIVGFSTEEWLGLLTPLYDLLSEHTTYQEGVPLELLTVFFEDKGKSLPTTFFEDLNLVSLNQLETFLSSNTLPIKEKIATEPTKAQTTVESFYEVPPEPSLGTMDNIKAQEVPRWKHYPQESEQHQSAQRVVEGSLAISIASKPEAVSKQTEKRPINPSLSLLKITPKETEETSVWKTHTPIKASAETPQAETERTTSLQKVISLERIILGELSPEQSAWFVRNLFDNNWAHYERVLLNLSQVTTWEAASQIIALDVFIPFKTNIYSEAAVAFTDLVESNFRV